MLLARDVWVANVQLIEYLEKITMSGVRRTRNREGIDFPVANRTIRIVPTATPVPLVVTMNGTRPKCAVAAGTPGYDSNRGSSSVDCVTQGRTRCRTAQQLLEHEASCRTPSPGWLVSGNPLNHLVRAAGRLLVDLRVESISNRPSHDWPGSAAAF